jgi:hypothetical protein
MYLREGDRVRIIDAPEYGGDMNDLTGTLMRIKQTPKDGCVFGVKIDYEYNIRSRKGLYWFYENHLTHSNTQEPDDDETNKPYFFPRINPSEEEISIPGYKPVQIRFVGGSNRDNEPTVYASYEPDIQVGDIVVVHMGRQGLAVAEVIDADLPPHIKVMDNREIISIVDMSAFRARRKITEKLDAIRRKMNSKLHVLSNQDLYDKLAETDPEMKALIAELESQKIIDDSADDIEAQVSTSTSDNSGIEAAFNMLTDDSFMDGLLSDV